VRADGAPFALAALLLAGPLPAQEVTPPWQPAGATMEALAGAVGQASRRDAIVAVGRQLNCDAGSTGVDSAAVEACAAFTTADVARLVAAFAGAVGSPLLDQWPSTNADYPPCDGERPQAVARIGAPVVGDREGRWEGRITVELSCRPLTGAA
jgi:hypothetical protein